MSQFESPVEPFQDRRSKPDTQNKGRERRQFSSSYDDLSPAGQKLGQAIDEYKLSHHRRFIDYDEMILVIESLGYKQQG